MRKRNLSLYYLYPRYSTYYQQQYESVLRKFLTGYEWEYKNTIKIIEILYTT